MHGRGVTSKEAAPAGGSAKFTCIDSFTGVYSFLDVEYLCPVVLWHPNDSTAPSMQTHAYPSALHALFAVQYPHIAHAIKEMDIKQLREVERTEDVCSDWAKIRLPWMNRIQRDKFRRHPELLEKLVDTGERELLYDTDRDTFWGRANTKGQNHLGRILIDIRFSAQNGTEFEEWLHLCVGIADLKPGIPPPDVLLIEEKNDEEQAKHRLSEKPYYTLGKMKDVCQVVALHPSVSRKHAMILHSKRGLGIIDLNSKLGTELNGQKLETSFFDRIQINDLIRLGASTRFYRVGIDNRGHLMRLEMEHKQLLDEVKKEEVFINEDKIKEVAMMDAARAATVFVGNLDFATKKVDLQMFFQEIGKPVEIRFPGAAKEGGKGGGEAQQGESAARGFAFVSFECMGEARLAAGLDGNELLGRKVRINLNDSSKGKGGSKGKDGKDGKGAKDSKDGKGKGGKNDVDDFFAQQRNLEPDDAPREKMDSRAMYMQAMRDRSRSRGRHSTSRDRERSRSQRRQRRSRSRSREERRHDRKHADEGRARERRKPACSKGATRHRHRRTFDEGHRTGDSHSHRREHRRFKERKDHDKEDTASVSSYSVKERKKRKFEDNKEDAASVSSYSVAKKKRRVKDNKEDTASVSSYSVAKKKRHVKGSKHNDTEDAGSAKAKKKRRFKESKDDNKDDAASSRSHNAKAKKKRRFKESKDDAASASDGAPAKKKKKHK